jgi:NDP-sugar pyrophosphorylase family protein
MIKQAVILAGGRGSRMKSSNFNNSLLDIPKPLVEVKGVPIIERILAKLSRYNISIAIVINPADEEKFRKKLYKYDIIYCYQNDPLGTGNALYSAKNFVTDDLFLVMMGDDISNLDFDISLNSNVPTVYGFKVEDISQFGALVLDAKGYAIEIIEKKLHGKGIANTGIYLMPKQFFDIYNKIPRDEKTGEYYLTDMVKLFYEKQAPFQVQMIDNWIGINTPNDLKIANKLDL